MATKAVKNRPRKPSPVIPRITKREQRAAVRSGWLDERVPEQELRQLVEDAERRTGAKIDFDAILPTIAKRVGWFRLTERFGGCDLEPAEIRDQARHTAEVVAELLDRLLHMHPTVEAAVGGYLWRLSEDHVITVRERLSPDLHRLRAALMAAEGDLRRTRVRSGPKRPSERNWALSEVYRVLREQSTPELGVTAARTLAADLLTLAEPSMSFPSDDKELRKAVGG